uniref:Protein patched homolog 1 (inferred by orthology to a human protein) n=1 Tax=Strongyloides venezuelensis TaxID=75913 RepID=A0A0K0FDZ6_STRVS
MLTLIEAPTGKNTDGETAPENSRQGQRLLDYSQSNNINNEFEDDRDIGTIRLTRYIKSWRKFFVGKSNSGDYSQEWKREFSLHPTMSDADMTLQQIYLDNAQGSIPTLVIRSVIQNNVYMLASYVQKKPWLILTIVVSLFLMCTFGLQHVRFEDDIVKLWVPKGGHLNSEINFYSNLKKEFESRKNVWSQYEEEHFIKPFIDAKLENYKDEDENGGSYQVLIQTGEEDGQNLLTKNKLLEHVELMKQIKNISVHLYGLNWTLDDICFKPGDLSIKGDSMAKDYQPIIESLIPCIWITPIDCFFEGSKPMGPNPPIELNTITLLGYITQLPEENTLKWTNINPKQVIDDISKVTNLGTMKEFFDRSEIGMGYLDRPCIDPLDPECPTTSSNYYDALPAFNIFKETLKERNISIDNILSKFVDSLNAFDFFFININRKQSTNDTYYNSYRQSFMNYLRNNKMEAEQLFSKTSYPVYPKYGDIVKNGCKGFARGVMNWSKNMIFGGINNTDDGEMTAEAMQTIILVSSPKEFYASFANNQTSRHKKLIQGNIVEEWNIDMAKEILKIWQRNFTQSIYNHELNFYSEPDYPDTKIERRRLHPLASTSIGDMLSEFCQFNYGVIFFGYGFMIVYAMYSQGKIRNYKLSHDSSVGLAFFGVLSVTLSSIAGLGVSTWLGIQFNAATTQIVPFLTLGIGVDNMFLLLHNYHTVTKSVKKNEVGVLLKETGMSILMTSTNNILSFLAGTVLPIPALRSFCFQSCILLTFNLIGIFTIFLAMISIDLRRLKDGRRDVFCCSYEGTYSDEEEDRGYGDGDNNTRVSIRNESIIERALSRSTAVSLNNNNAYQSLNFIKGNDDDDVNGCSDQLPAKGIIHRLLRKYYIPFLRYKAVKALILIFGLTLGVIGYLGTFSIKQGLELSDVLPEHTAPAAFLRARDRYFSFYPMSLVIRGENVDFATKQKLIENLRSDVGRLSYVVKNAYGQPSEPFWMDLFKNWLMRLQEKIDKAGSDGLLVDFDKRILNGSEEVKYPDLQVAYSLLCSYGDKEDCSRVGKVKLIENGIINEEGFYNYLYGWHEYESMLYTVSQAKFYPPLYKLKEGTGNMTYRYFIPPVPRPRYSEIPFYMTGLSDTETIVQMIKEVRAICSRYTELGVDNFPSGIAFVFWDQYLNLNVTILKAIAIITFAVFIVITILLFNIWASACICFTLMIMTLELAGFLGYSGIKLNPVSAVSLITAVGIGVEFTVHVMYSYLTALGSRQKRMEMAIDRVFVPVIHGAISTLLGILMLGFSEFEFVVKYFFIIMSALIIIGLINGLIFMPVLLSLFGPNTEIKIKGNRKRLPPPPPLSRDIDLPNRRIKTRSSVTFPTTHENAME